MRPPDAAYAQTTARLFHLLLSHVSLDSRPPQAVYSDHDLIELAEMAQLIVRLDSYSVPRDLPLYAPHEAMLAFAKARLGHLEYRDRAFFAVATGVADPWLETIGNPANLERAERQAQSALGTTLRLMTRFHGTEALDSIGIAPISVETLNRSSFTLGDLPTRDYPQLLRIALAACFYDDLLSPRLDDYGLDTAMLDNGSIQIQCYEALKSIDRVSPKLAATHEALFDFVNVRMFRIYLQLEAGAASSDEERHALLVRVGQAKAEEGEAVVNVQSALRQFRTIFGTGALRTIGLVPSILDALDCADLANDLRA